MENTDYENTRALLDNYEELLPDLKEESHMLKVRSDFAEATSFEKQLVANTHKLNKVLEANHQINKQIIADYQNANQKLDDMNKVLTSSIDKLVEKADDKMDTCFKKCFDESESVTALNRQNTQQLQQDYDDTLSKYQYAVNDLTNKFNSYGNEIESLKDFTKSYVKKSLFIAGLIFIVSIIITAIVACSSSYLVLSLMPELSNAWKNISSTAWIILIVLFIATIVGGIVFVKNRRSR